MIGAVIESTVGAALGLPVALVDVDLVAVFQKHAAVGWLAESAEFDVEMTIAELLMGDDAIAVRDDLHGAVAGELPLGWPVFLEPVLARFLRPGVQIIAVEQNNGVLWRRGAKGR